MRTIQIDDDVYRALEARVRGFEDTPNDVLRLILGPKTQPSSTQKTAKSTDTGASRKRGKAPKADLRALVRAGFLTEGETLFMHDYQGNRLNGIQAKIRDNKLEFEGQRLSMSDLTKQEMQRRGYKSNSYRGPQFWYTNRGKSVKELWDEYLQTAPKEFRG